jgi:hypothetical protein
VVSGVTPPLRSLRDMRCMRKRIVTRQSAASRTWGNERARQRDSTPGGRRTSILDKSYEFVLDFGCRQGKKVCRHVV